MARTRTISTLTQLDGNRARTIFVFLSEALLTGKPDPIISFENADLSNTKWSKADLSGVNLMKANLSGVNLMKANLMKANLSRDILSGADLNGAILAEADIRGANLSGVNLSGAKLSGAKLGGSDLSNATLHGAYLNGGIKLFQGKFGEFNTDLSGGNLRWSDLRGADFSMVDLSGADLSGVNLRNALNLKHTLLDKTLLLGVTGLTTKQIAHCKANGAIVDEEATPSAPPAQNATAISPQKAILQTSFIQEAAPTQEHIAVKKEAPSVAPSSDDHTAPYSSSQGPPLSALPQQEYFTPPLPSQDKGS
ncbi:hypothetical protein KDA_47010 [Dictyobacter alpinus]|uniref:Pentapeptide repeat-containing protein n=1 Tax=Dictyobacter alpinus TaxID=2014873 RepID=A0A402BD58_9CHLR|nr:pentapeptide repeat-containing protein [Dictyobacter alpinus]GCE29217.1 hypothetical protein KDA_47010 [Dictyobacter alpinus]